MKFSEEIEIRGHKIEQKTPSALTELLHTRWPHTPQANAAKLETAFADLTKKLENIRVVRGKNMRAVQNHH